MGDLTNYLKKHPRMIGVLFAILLALLQAGTGAAAWGGGFVGT